MKDLNQFIIEKYLIDKDTKINDPKVDDPSTWDVGDILVGTISYSMTLVKFFKIKRRTAKKFDVVELADDARGMYGECSPIEDKEGKAYSGRLNKYGTVVIDNYRCYLWDGNPVYYNHLD